MPLRHRRDYPAALHHGLPSLPNQGVWKFPTPMINNS